MAVNLAVNLAANLAVELAANQPMSAIVSVTALVLGAGLIVTHLTVAIAAAVKAPGGDVRIHTESTRRVFDLLDRVGRRASLILAGVVLVIVAALTAGALSTTVIFGT